ncbi:MULTISPECIES: hypothetical protein [unclassified Bacillus (in: firmicutes)]|nr:MULTISPECIES: hypothetical protein [unclassified Bacillus (in: firmicutes)]
MDVLQFVQSYIMKSAEKIDRLYVRKEHNVTNDYLHYFLLSHY